MFQKARVKLTVWYLIIIMVISLLFSTFIYSSINSELSRFERMDISIQEGHHDGNNPPSQPRFARIRAADIEAARMRLIASLGLINLFILIVAGTAGYFLAGRTLKPIKEMIDEQNRFITDASHELRTPITSLKSEIEVSLRDKKLTTFGAKKVLASNLEEVNGLQMLSDELIMLAQNKKVNGFKLTTIMLAPLIKKAISKVKKTATARKIKIEENVKNIKISGDQQSLTQLLVILLDNAIKYSPSKTNIQIVSEITKNKLIIKIIDQGVGISKKEIPHIFDRFYRSDQSRNQDGYGLGLSIAKQIVEMHSGTIAVQSQEKSGSSFIIILPLNG